jgi:hypothetical protein
LAALTLNDYLFRLPKDRQAMMRALRTIIRKNLPPGYVERLEEGILIYEIPLEKYPTTYNGRPLRLAALASQKTFVTLYLMAVYGDRALAEWFREAYASSGKRLRMGKSCVHLRKIDDIPFDVIGRAIAAVPAAAFIEIYERARGDGARRK